MEPLIITVAAVGAELTPTEQPNLPITPEQVGEDAARCEEAGASIYHLHVRDSQGRPTMDVDAYRAAAAAIAERSDLIVQFSTGGAVGDTEEDRIRPLDLKPEMATLTTGSVNFGDEIFENPWPLVSRLHARMIELGVLPEFEIFEPGMMATAERVYEANGADHHRHFDFVLGVPGALPAWADALDFLLAHLPTGATWSATGIGRSHVEIAGQTIERGGHVRTGFEDVLWFEKGKLAFSNSQLVERVVGIAQGLGREIATPEQTRQLLGLAR